MQPRVEDLDFGEQLRVRLVHPQNATYGLASAVKLIEQIFDRVGIVDTDQE